MPMQEYFKKLSDLIKSKNAKNIYYFDVPLYPNVGDHLIARGTFAFFKKFNITPIVSTNMDCIKQFTPSTGDLILFGGGGNFGDLYKKHNDLRTAFITKHRNLQYIILPQTIYYASEENFIADKTAFQNTSNITILARDKESLDIAKQFSNNAFLFPDMAHCLYEEFTHLRESKDKKGTLFFFRTDSEKSLALQKNNQTINTIDWPTFLTKNEVLSLEKLARRQKWLRRLHLASFYGSPFFNEWQKTSTPITDRAASLFSSYEDVQSDRLHALILGHLLGLNPIPVDNSYGKVMNYYQIWLKNPNTAGDH